jgi:catechol 2,3-dioxygenase-like lactoylglutathione lyase family enzyme
MVSHDRGPLADPMRLAQVRLVTTDVVRLSEFYRQLTLCEPMGSEDYVELHLGDAGIAITSQSAADLYGANAATAAQNRSAIIDLEVGDLDAERARLTPLDVYVVLEPVTQPWGNRAMLFRDPDGNLINLFSRGERQ